MRCSGCGATNPVEGRYCISCGLPLGPTCPGCRQPTLPGARFCGACGRDLIGKRPDAPHVVAERRLVSVLFADLVDSTARAEGRDVEETRAFLDAYYEVARAVIGRHGGTVEKFIGDAVMAVWGAPVAREDDAERSVRAALELVDAVQRLGPEVAARAAVVTGQAAVNLGEDGQALVAGDLVNTASRLQGAAAPGSVLVAETTVRTAGTAIAFEPAGERLLRGKASPTAAWRALRVVGERSGRPEALSAPFVGRETELRLLKDVLHANTAERRARLVLVTGDAGIGKTRLARELGLYAEGLVEPITWLEGRSPAYGDGITFWALGEMVRRQVGLRETADEATVREQVAAGVDRLIGAPDERRRIEAALLALLGVEAAPPGGPGVLVAAWRAFFESLAAQTTTVLVFEDLQWADGGLLDFIDQILDWSRDLPLLLVGLARPELLARRASWAAGRRGLLLHLDPLPDAATRAMLVGLAPDLPAAAVDSIVARAAGIPLYAIEFVRMLVAEGRLFEEDGTLRPSGELATLAIPETLHALIAARLDALEPAERALLEDAAVLGHTFTLGALAAVSDLPEAVLEPRLRSLVQRDLLMLSSDPAAPDRGEYAFVQSLVHDVSYGTLALAQRQRRHLAAARHFTSLESNELAGVVAAHRLAAYRCASPGREAEALGPETRAALREAAARALALGSPTQARTFLEQALDVAPAPAERADLLRAAGEAATACGDWEAAERLLDSALEAFGGLGDTSGRRHTLASLGCLLNDRFHCRRALQRLGPELEAIAKGSVGPAEVELLAEATRATYLVFDTAGALVLAERTIAAAEHCDLDPLVADMLVTKGMVLANSKRAREGICLLEGGLRLADRLGLVETSLRAYHNLTQLYMDRDRTAARESVAAGAKLAQRYGWSQYAEGFLTLGALLSWGAGRWDRAVARLEEALAPDAHPTLPAWLASSLACFRAARGEPIDELIAEAEAEVARAADPQLVALLHWALAEAALAARDLPRVRREWRATRLAGDWRWIPGEARAAALARDAAAVRELLARHAEESVPSPRARAEQATMRASLAALDGEPDAVERYGEAIQAWRDLRALFYEALTGLDMANLLNPRLPEVGTAAVRSRAIFERLRARPYVAWLDELIPAAEPALT